MQNHTVCATQKFARGVLEILCICIEHCKVEIGVQETDHAIRLHDYVLGSCDLTLDIGHGLAQAALPRAHPERASGARDQETRGVAFPAQVSLVAQSAEMVVSGIAI